MDAPGSAVPVTVVAVSATGGHVDHLGRGGVDDGDDAGDGGGVADRVGDRVGQGVAAGRRGVDGAADRHGRGEGPVDPVGGSHPGPRIEGGPGLDRGGGRPADGGGEVAVVVGVGVGRRGRDRHVGGLAGNHLVPGRRGREGADVGGSGGQRAAVGGEDPHRRGGARAVRPRRQVSGGVGVHGREAQGLAAVDDPGRAAGHRHLHRARPAEHGHHLGVGVGLATRVGGGAGSARRALVVAVGVGVDVVGQGVGRAGIGEDPGDARRVGGVVGVRRRELGEGVVLHRRRDALPGVGDRDVTPRVRSDRGVGRVLAHVVVELDGEGVGDGAGVRRRVGPVLVDREHVVVVVDVGRERRVVEQDERRAVVVAGRGRVPTGRGELVGECEVVDGQVHRLVHRGEPFACRRVVGDHEGVAAEVRVVRAARGNGHPGAVHQRERVAGGVGHRGAVVQLGRRRRRNDARHQPDAQEHGEHDAEGVAQPHGESPW